jgi:flagellar biosynthesis/type III secretory pathway protein FliH
MMQRSEAYFKKWQEGFEAGFAKGYREGLDRATKEITITALREGYLPEAIRTLTGLSLGKIEKLREHLGDE